MTIGQKLNGVWKNTSISYSQYGKVTSVTDAKSHKWSWTYDLMDRVLSETNWLGQRLNYTWDKNSNLKTHTDALGQKWEFTWGTGDLLTLALFKRANGTTESSITCNYNPTTHLIDSIVDSAAGTFSFTYDSIDRVWTETSPLGTITHTLDDLDRPTGVQIPGQAQITYGYSPTDEVTSVTQSGLTSTFEYDPLGRMTKRTLPNGVSTEWAFNNSGFLTSVLSKSNGSTIDSHTYQRDLVGSVTQETHTIGGQTWTNTFGYDDWYRLTSATVYGTSYAWSYDDVGNRLSQTVGGQTTSYTYNDANRLTAVNGAAVTHDANGNLTAYGSDTYGWDVRGRLVSLTRPGLTAAFAYDYQNRRTSKTINGVTTSFLSDGDDVY